MKKNLIFISLLAFGLIVLSGCGGKPPIQETPTNGTIPADCISYFDGCNTCMVQDGVVGGCTKMYCSPENMQEPKCLETVNGPVDDQIEDTQISENPGEQIDLTNCKSYFDGCNNCVVENGQVTACTLMYCENPGEPKCNEYID